jgi:hypothetical protein
MKIGFHPQADAEFAAAIQHYESRQAGLGIKLYREALARLDWITVNPELPRLRRNYRRVNLTVFPFFIAYVLEQETIWVVAVAHGHRRPGYWLERLREK